MAADGRCNHRYTYAGYDVRLGDGDPLPAGKCIDCSDVKYFLTKFREIKQDGLFEIRSTGKEVDSYATRD